MTHHDDENNFAADEKNVTGNFKSINNTNLKRKGAMDGALGGKHLAEYLPSAKKPPRPTTNKKSADIAP